MVDRWVRRIVDVSLALHFAAGAGWWWFSPQGFAVGSNPFWTNSVLPVAAMGVAGVGLVALHFGRRAAAAGAVLCFVTAWAAAAVAGRIAFPISLAGVWLLFFAVACTGGALFVLLVRGERKRPAAWMASAVCGAAVGLLVVRWQIPEQPSTIPWKAAATRGIVDGNSHVAQPSERVVDGAEYFPAPATLKIQRGNVRIECSPLLEFDRVSPDRFWSLLAPRSSIPIRRYVSDVVTDESRTFQYDDGAAVEIPTRSTDGVISITAYSPVDRAMYSHLNTYCYLAIDGHRSLSLSFSTCPETIIDVLPADYPIGRPARFAYVDAAETFQVCEATSGEKGPFHSLATGTLRRGEPLTIFLFDEGKRLATITLDDWSAQASNAISPSAGWGVPVNAIEFQRLGESPSSSAKIWITLAATAIGRGFETVGHAAGTYRNRVTFQFEPAAP